MSIRSKMHNYSSENRCRFGYKKTSLTAGLVYVNCYRSCKANPTPFRQGFAA